MSAILYKRVDGEVIAERVNPIEVSNLLDNGYFASPELAEADENETGKLSNKEIREAAKAAGVTNWKTAKIETLTKKLEDEQD